MTFECMQCGAVRHDLGAANGGSVCSCGCSSWRTTVTSTMPGMAGPGWGSFVDLNVPDPKKPCVPLPLYEVISCPACVGSGVGCETCNRLGVVRVLESAIPVYTPKATTSATPRGALP